MVVESPTRLSPKTLLLENLLITWTKYFFTELERSLVTGIIKKAIGSLLSKHIIMLNAFVE